VAALHTHGPSPWEGGGRLCWEQWPPAAPAGQEADAVGRAPELLRVRPQLRHGGGQHRGCLCIQGSARDEW